MINESEKGVIFEDAINCMISALEYKDLYTKGHSRRVGEMSAVCAKKLNLSPYERFYIEIAGHLHDIGKIGIPDSVLLKKGKLDDFEWREMKRHPVISADIISEAGHLGEVAEIVYQHHERWDGNGYPEGLKKNDIKLGARILALCDTIDAMASNRSYRKSLTWDFIETELSNNMGTQFDSDLAFLIPVLIEYWRNNFELNYDNINQNDMQLNNLIDQHSKIRELISSISDDLKKDYYLDNPNSLLDDIGKLSSILRIHLNGEDRYLYPNLMISKDKEVMKIAKTFDQTMGNLNNSFVSFKTRYNTLESIINNYDAVVIELNEIFNLLIQRLNKEDFELYPLLDMSE